MFVTSDLSIFNSVAGSAARYSIDAFPVPKSSTDTPRPLARKARSTETACLGSDIAALSVTSRTTASGLMPRR